MTRRSIAIIDHGTGNLFSVSHALEKIGAKPYFVTNAEEILSASHIVLPGVGAFADGMSALKRLGLIEAIIEVASNKPLLGICLGMQMLFDESEEMGINPGLGLISGKVCRIPGKDVDGNILKIPHIGWNGIVLPEAGTDWGKTVLENIENGEAMYFVHSYVPEPINKNDCIAECIYGGHRLAIVTGHENITGCQFHPERSGPAGLRILQNFVNI